MKESSPDVIQRIRRLSAFPSLKSLLDVNKMLKFRVQNFNVCYKIVTFKMMYCIYYISVMRYNIYNTIFLGGIVL